MAGGSGTGKDAAPLVPATPSLVVAGLDPAPPIGSAASCESGAGSRPAMTALRCPPHPRDHLLDMRDRRLGQDAVAEIEDVGAALGGTKHGVDPMAKQVAAGDESDGIEVALRREFFGQLGQDDVEVERPIERDGVSEARLDDASEVRSTAANEDDRLRPRPRAFKAAHDGADRIDRERPEQ